MATTVNIYEAKTQLSSLVERAANGEEIVIAKAGKPKARLVPVEPAERGTGSPEAGRAKSGLTATSTILCQMTFSTLSKARTTRTTFEPAPRHSRLHLVA